MISTNMLCSTRFLLLLFSLHPPSCMARSRLQLSQHGLPLFRNLAQVDADATIISDFNPVIKRNDLNTNPNGSTFLWLLQDEYSGQTFFDRFAFFTNPDPTNGQVNYVDQTTAFQNGLAYVQDDGIVVMKGDNTTTLQSGAFRDSVRISSLSQYTTGLFILDLNRAPWGCGVWPAFWTLGNGDWPNSGEVDIIEGVHDNEHNQVAWHTRAGCELTPESNFTGTVVQLNGQDNLVCNGNVNQNSGCSIIELSRASYGPYFDSIGGGVFAMKWDENGIAVWSFYRATIPKDITEGTPDPSQWGQPSAALEPGNCNPLQYFYNHSIIFDITFCGDWAGNSYATSGCPGTCQDRLMDPSNFVNASWSINSLKVYRKQLIKGRLSNGANFVPRGNIFLHIVVILWIALIL